MEEFVSKRFISYICNQNKNLKTLRCTGQSTIIMNTEKDWEKYIEEERDVVVAELEAEGYEKVEEGVFIFGTWSVTLQRGDERVELACGAYEQVEVDDGSIVPEEAHWWVELISVWDARDEEATRHVYPED